MNSLSGIGNHEYLQRLYITLSRMIHILLTLIFTIMDWSNSLRLENSLRYFLPAYLTNGCFLNSTEFESDLPVQLNPSPMYPGRQVQVKLPGVFVQAAAGLQIPFFTEHSSTSITCKNTNEIAALNCVSSETPIRLLTRMFISGSTLIYWKKY